MGEMADFQIDNWVLDEEEYEIWREHRMTDQVKGTVETITENERQTRYGKKMAYSVLMSEDDYEGPAEERWYGHGFKIPQFKAGDYIEFEAVGKDVKGTMYYNFADPEKVEVKQAPTPAPKASGSGGGKKLSKDGYWTAKEERDVATTRQVRLHASRGSAIELVNVLVANGLAVLPKTKAKQEDHILDLVDRYTERFYEQATLVVYNDNYDDEVLEAAAAVTPVVKVEADTEEAEGDDDDPDFE